jgi:hypothetical protein
VELRDLLELERLFDRHPVNAVFGECRRFGGRGDEPFPS